MASAPRLLLVDDEKDSLYTMRRALERLGYGVAAETSAQKALERFAREEFDLVILDIKMAGMDGYTLYEKMVAIRPATKACFLTANAEHNSEFKERHPALGSNCFLLKPISFERLAAAIKALVGDP
ncbi:response regulator [Nitrososphaera sp.]|uniref:response regulator n=1 Tax=Nitrososphaera sp. TaxID=1971748 RepID=UPI00307F1ACA